MFNLLAFGVVAIAFLSTMPENHPPCKPSPAPGRPPQAPEFSNDWKKIFQWLEKSVRFFQ
ncbi:MAG: hypothetical protein IKQ15_03595 [Kiritimatiellae bacterium]|nr:hypothetical protein [Kiritimatiellia bacterium]